jgi:PPOX class probable F420-dependent enzyme
MSEAEVRAFLSEGTRTGKLATTRADGRSHIAPIWFVLDDDGTIVFNTGADTVKGRTIARDPRVSLCVDDDQPPFSFVVIEGTVEVSDDLEEMLIWATRIAARYMGDDRAEAFGRRNAVAGELLVRLSPANVTKVVAFADLSD